MAQPDNFDNVLPLAPKPTVSVVMVTPDMAQRWLDQNTRNRSVRPAKVDQYAMDMLEGNWKLTGEPIKFSSSGRLLDGQHRLMAIVESQETVALFVARGLDDEAQSFMDTGMARTAGDNLGMAGEVNGPLLAAAARIGVLVDEDLLGKSRSASAISHARIYRWVNHNPAMRRSVAFVASGEPHRVPMAPSIKAYAHFRFSLRDVEAADQFWFSLGAMVNLAAGSPILALAHRLQRIESHRTRVDQRDLLSITFRAWNAWRQGRSLARIPATTRSGRVDIPDVR